MKIRKIMEQTQDITSACPECGCKEYINPNLVGEGYRECKKCRQEWWIDIDYKQFEIP